MSHLHSLNADQLPQALKAAPCWGARAARLVRHDPGVMELLPCAAIAGSVAVISSGVRLTR
jgi:hypothetical protein